MMLFISARKGRYRLRKLGVDQEEKLGLNLERWNSGTEGGFLTDCTEWFLERGIDHSVDFVILSKSGFLFPEFQRSRLIISGEFYGEFRSEEHTSELQSR